MLNKGDYTLELKENSEVIHAFLAVTISIIAMKETSSASIKAMNLFLNYCRLDPSVFASFRPDRALLKQVNLTGGILSKNREESETSKEFASFVLRYHENVDYGDFSDDPTAI